MSTKEETTAKLLKRLPEEYRDRVDYLEPGEGLIDGCRYILKYTKDYTDGDVAGGTYPVRSVSEAARFVETSLWKVSAQP